MEKEIKGGVIVKHTSKVFHYQGQGDHTLTEVRLPFMGKTANCKKYVSEDSVTVENKHLSVTVNPDGTFEVRLHDQVQDLINGVKVKEGNLK